MKAVDATAPTVRGTPRGPVALALIAASLGGYWIAAISGPSVVSHPLTVGVLPPYSLGLHPAPIVVITLLWAATVAGAAGTWLALRALSQGWAPKPEFLLAAALVASVAFVVVPPVNSDDVYSYAAYGRMAATGHDPYTTSASDLPADPVAQAVTPPWRDTPTVYGPIATGEQAIVMHAAGSSVPWGVLELSALGAVAFLATAGILHRYAAGAAARRRAVICWALNPLLLFQLVGGAHLDTLGVLAVVVALGLAARARISAAGAVVGAAIAVKLTGGVAAIGLAWAMRRKPRQLFALVAGGVLIVVPAYVLAGGSTTLRQVRKASRFVSFGSWWRPIVVGLEHALGSASARQITSAAALIAFAALSFLLWNALQRSLVTQRDTQLQWLAALLLAPTLAWLLTTTYSLPWYAAWAWPLLALLVASRWDDVLLAWTAVLTIAYIPGRDVPLPAGLAGVTRGLRSGLGPTALAVILVWAILLAVRAVRSADPVTSADPAP